MKRLTLYLLPVNLERVRKPFELFATLGGNQFWVWCINLDHMLKRQRSRLGLESLTDDQLHDVGITREDAEAELSKQFWQD